MVDPQGPEDVQLLELTMLGRVVGLDPGCQPSRLTSTTSATAPAIEGALGSAVGTGPEQIDPSSGELTGNFPQAFSHIGVIASGVTLARAMRTAR
jgi:hypothetical protein